MRQLFSETGADMNEEIRQQNSNQQEEASEREKKGQEMIGKRKPEKKENGWGSFLAGAVTVILLLTVIRTVSHFIWLPGGTDTPTSVQTSEKIRTIEQLIDEVYVGEKDEEALAEGMYRGLISGLGDRYADYYTEEEFQELATSQEGYYEGVGITIGQTEEGAGLTIVEVTDGSPAAEAGIQAGDILIAVDGTDVTSMTVTEAAALIREGENDTINLTVEREGTGQIQAEVTREKLETQTVAGKMLTDTIGYLAISQFTGLTSDQFADVYQQLQEEGLQKLLIDLRGNPGGLVTAVCDTLRQILPEGLIVYTEDKQGNREEYTCEGETPLDIPLVVLVDENTASAGEIFTGAVKDYGLGTIVGTQTFGKGIVQDFYTLPDQSVVKLTVAHYYTPHFLYFCIKDSSLCPLFHILKLFSASFSASISQLYRFLKKIAPTPQIPIRTG